MAQRKAHRVPRFLPIAAIATVLLVNVAAPQARAQSVPAQAAAALSTDDFVQAVTTLSMFSQRAGKLAQVLGQNNDVRRYGRDLADDQKPIQTLNQGLAAAKIDPPTITALPSNQADVLQTLHRIEDREFDRMFTDLQVQAQQTALTIIQSYAQAGDNPAVKSVALKLATVFEQRLAQARAMQKAVG